MRFLSDEWFAAMSQAIDDVEVPPDIEVSIAQVVTDPTQGELRWTLQCANGRCHITRDDGDAGTTLRSTREIAFAIATGALSAGRAVLHGDLVISGDPMQLVAASGAMDTIRAALAPLSESVEA